MIMYQTSSNTEMDPKEVKRRERIRMAFKISPQSLFDKSERDEFDKNLDIIEFMFDDS